MDDYGNEPATGVLVEVVNRGERAVRVTMAAFRTQGGGPDVWVVATAMWRGDRLPFAVPSHDSGERHVRSHAA